MDRRHIQLVLRQAAAAGRPGASDADLLRRFAAERDEAAFAELVRRHGRLVWALCRNLLPGEADADDAFQATFLAFARSAGTIRAGNRVGPWLHGVAYRVCLKARRAAARRRKREQAAAATEAALPVADSAWDAALAAVHEEVCRLPESLRVPFVLCCLEGKGVTEAAAQLGWKLGTLSARLTRAKQTLIDRLGGRGLPAAAVAAAAITAGASSAEVPAALAARAAALAAAPESAPSTIVSLTHGVTTMTAFRAKLLAAALLVGGLTAGVGSGWLATATAQSPKKPAEATPAASQQGKQPQPPPNYQQEVLGFFLQGLEYQRPATPGGKPASKWEYDFVPASEMTTAKFTEFLKDREARGWEFNGQATLLHDGKPAATWVFRRPAGQAAGAAPIDQQLADAWHRSAQAHTKANAANCTQCHVASPDATWLRRAWLDVYGTLPPAPNQQPADAAARARQLDDLLKKNQVVPDLRTPGASRARELEDQIKKLQAELDRLRAQTNRQVTLGAAEVGMDPNEMMVFLDKLAAKRFGPGHRQRLGLGASSAGLDIFGDAEAVEWAVGVVRKLNEK